MVPTGPITGARVAEKYQPRMARAMIVWKLAGPADSHSRRSVTLAWRNRPPAAHDLFGGVFVVLRPSIVMLYMAYCSPPIPPLLRDKAMLCIGGHFAMLDDQGLRSGEVRAPTRSSMVREERKE